MKLNTSPLGAICLGYRITDFIKTGDLTTGVILVSDTRYVRIHPDMIESIQVDESLGKYKEIFLKNSKGEPKKMDAVPLMFRYKMRSGEIFLSISENLFFGTVNIGDQK